MPRYFFHLITLDGPAIDEHGVDLPDIAAVRVRAIRELGEVLADFPDLTNQIEVRDESGEAVMVVRAVVDP